MIGFTLLFCFIWFEDLVSHAFMLGSRLLSIVNSLLVFGRTEDRFRFRSDGARWCTVVRIDVRQALVALALLEEEVSSFDRFECWHPG